MWPLRSGAGCTRPLSYAWAACPFCGRERKGFALERRTVAAPAEPVPVDGHLAEPIEPTQKLRRPSLTNSPVVAPAPAISPAPAFTSRAEADAADAV